MKLCECGCGKEVKKESNRFLVGHWARINNPLKGVKFSKEVKEQIKSTIKFNKSIILSFCGCGCGKEVKRKGNRFIRGHNVKINNPMNNEEAKKKRSLFLKGKTLSEEHKKKIGEASKGEKNGMFGRTHSEETREKIREATKKQDRKNNSNWKGGVSKKNIALYETYAHQLSPIEEVRRIRFTELGQANLRVRCYHCKKWIVPTAYQVRNRIKSINKGSYGDHFYCKEECKQSCSIYRQRLFPKGFKSSNHNIDPYWRSEVIKRAKGRCERCNTKTDKLHAHHEKPATLFPMLANDIDNGWAVCEPCHYILIHGQEGCRLIDLQRKC